MTEQKSIYEEVAELLYSNIKDRDECVDILQENFGPLLKAGVSCACFIGDGFEEPNDEEVAAAELLLSAKERI